MGQHSKGKKNQFSYPLLKTEVDYSEKNLQLHELILTVSYVR